MDRKKLFTILAAESVFLIVLCALTMKLPDSFSSILNFPFEQIGAGLSALHGLGSIGAGTAYALLVGLSLLTAVPAVRGKKTPVERAILVLFALSVFATLYVMMNPWSVTTPYDDARNYAKLMFSITTWSVLILYLVVRVVRLLREGDRDTLTRYFDIALYALAMLCAEDIVVRGAGRVQTAMVLSYSGIDFLFALLSYAAMALPYVLNSDNHLRRRVHGRGVERRCRNASAEGRTPDEAVLRASCGNGGNDRGAECFAGLILGAFDKPQHEPANTRFQHCIYSVCPAVYAHSGRKPQTARR